MTITKVINSGFYHCGQTFQEVKDLYPNGVALYYHADLKEKTLPLEEFYRLRIFSGIHCSRLFIFRDYSFEIEYIGLDDRRVKFLPKSKIPYSPNSLFIQEGLYRITKGVIVLAITILTFPIWAIVLTKSYKEVAAVWKAGIQRGYLGKEISLPPEMEDSHITAHDILKIGRVFIGYRHVSSEELAQDNAKKGIPDGCSLNLSFCSSESSEKARFENLDKKIQKGERCDELISLYEKAITEFIEVSIKMDLNSVKNYGEVLSTIDRTRFMVVKTGWFSAADVWRFGGLGRFPKERISPDGVILLRRLRKENLGISETKSKESISSLVELDLLVTYLASHYRRELMRYLREDFRPSQFRINRR